MIDFSSKTDEQLVSFCKRGYRKAFDELIFRHESYLKNWIYRFCKGNGALSEEIFSLTLVKTWQKIKTFKGNSAFKTWASTISRNCFYDEYRRATRRTFCNIDDILSLSSGNRGNLENPVKAQVSPEFDFTEKQLPSDLIEKKEKNNNNSKLIKKIFSKLKDKEKEILILRDMKGLGYSSIAKKLKIPIGTVMSRLYYARRKAYKISQSSLK